MSRVGKLPIAVPPGVEVQISADQITELLGSDQLADMAGKVGIQTDELAQQLSKVLPDAVDKLTPDGEVPDADKVEDALGGLGKLLGR